MDKISVKNGLKKYFTPAYIVVVAVFMCWFFFKTRHSVYLYLQNFTLGYALLGAVFVALFYIFQLNAFVAIQSKNAQINPKTISQINWSYAYLYGLMGHYIPGKISVVLGRIMALGPLGISKKAAVLSVLYETGIAVALSFVMGLPLIFIVNIAGLSNVYVQSGLMAAVLIGFAVFIFTPLFQKSIFIMLRIFKLELPDKNIFLDKPTLLKAIIHYFISNIFLIFSFYFFCLSITTLPFDIKTIYISGGSMVFSVALGIIALFAPSGLGVREAGVVYVMAVATNLMPMEAALLTAICYRFVTAIVEVVLFAVAAILHKRQTNM